MEAKQAIGYLWAAQEFVKWKTLYKDNFLTHLFMMPDADLKGEWQIGYYSPHTEMMTSFFLNFDDRGQTVIEISPETEVFKKEEDQIRELDTKKILVDYDEAMSIANDIMTKEYPKEPIMKRVVILQVLEEGQLWNITFVSQAFATINVKVSSETGKIIRHDKKSLISFDK